MPWQCQALSQISHQLAPHNAGMTAQALPARRLRLSGGTDCLSVLLPAWPACNLFVHIVTRSVWCGAHPPSTRHTYVHCRAVGRDDRHIMTSKPLCTPDNCSCSPMLAAGGQLI